MAEKKILETTVFNIEVVKEADLIPMRKGKRYKYPFAQLHIGEGFRINEEKAAKRVYASMYNFMTKYPNIKLKMFRTRDNLWMCQRVN